MTKNQIKRAAQDQLMAAMQTAFYAIYESGEVAPEDQDAVRDEADRQMRRVEKLFGYEPGSWGRG